MGVDWSRSCVLACMLLLHIGCGDDATSTTGDAFFPDANDPCSGNTAGQATIVDGPGGGAGNDGTFRSLIVHPTNPDIVYIGSERNGMFRSLDGGATWERLRAGLRHVAERYPEVWDIQIAASNPDVLYAATVDSPGPTQGDFPTATAGVYKSTDAGLSWRQVNCGLENSRAITVQIDPTNADVAVVAIGAGVPSFSDAPLPFYNGGIFTTSNGGAMWTAASIPAGYSDQSYWKSVRRAGALITYAVTSTPGGTNRGYIKSVDGGLTWLPLAGTPTSYVVEWDVSTDGMTFWTHERDSFEILHSQNSGQSFDVLQINSVNGMVAVSPVDPDSVLYSDINVLYRTDDAFATTPTQIASTGVTEIVFAPSNPMIVYLANGLVLHKSTDGGLTFTPLVNLRTEVLGG